MSKIQNSDVKSQAELVSAGATAAQLINDTKIYVTANSLNKRLDEAITAGDIGGGSSTGTVFELKATELIGGWSTGNNAAPLGGGSLAGTFVKDSSTPLNGTDSYIYTQAGGSLNDYILSPAQAVARRYRGTTCTLYFPFQYDGNGGDVSVVIYDATSAVVLTQNSLTVLPASNGVTSQYQLPIIIPASCASIRVGFQVGVANSGKILRFDDVVFSSNNAMNAPLANITAWQSFTPTGSWSTNTTYTGRLRQVGEMLEVQCLIATSGAPNAVSLTVNMPPGYIIDTNKLAFGTRAGTSLPGSNAIVYDTALGEFLAEVVYSSTTVVALRRVRTNVGTNSVPVISNATVGDTDPFTWGAGDYASISFTVPCVGLTATSPSIVTASESFSTDTASLAYAGSATYTLSTLASAPVGTFITFTYASTSNTRTQTNAAAPTQTTADMAINGIQLFTRAYNAASTAASPSVVAIQIGKGLKGVSRNLYQSVGKVNAGSLDIEVHSSTNQNGIALKDYNEQTGILMLDAGYCHVATITTSNMLFSDLSSSTSGYLVINASKNPALTGIASSVCSGRAIATSGQSVANTGSPIKVQWDASPTFSSNITWDSANHRFVAQQAGHYNVTSSVTYSSLAWTSGDLIIQYLYKNGSQYTILGRIELEATRTWALQPHGSDLVYLAVGDYVEIFTSHNRTGGASALNTTSGLTYFSINKVGGLG
jgi:hypothetical protein